MNLTQEQRDAITRLQDEAGYTSNSSKRHVFVEDLRTVLPLLAAPTQPQGGALTDAADVAAFIERKADDYAREYGVDDMGSLSFGNDTMRDYHWGLLELADEIRNLAAPRQPEDVGAGVRIRPLDEADVARMHRPSASAQQDEREAFEAAAPRFGISVDKASATAVKAGVHPLTYKYEHSAKMWELWQMAWEAARAAQHVQADAGAVACKGMNCFAADGVSHSLECQAEHAAAIAGGRFVK